MSAPSWQILPDPVTPNLASVVITHADTGRSLSVGFSGRGLLFPFRRDGRNDFTNGIGVALTQSAIALVLGTIAGSPSSQGELPWRTEFGSLVHLLRLRSNSPALAELTKSRIGSALERWVPWVRLRKVIVVVQGDTFRITIGYDIVDTSVERILVPGLETSVAVG